MLLKVVSLSLLVALVVISVVLMYFVKKKVNMMHQLINKH